MRSGGSNEVTSTAGTANTGGGGGAGADARVDFGNKAPGRNGGSGVVIISTTVAAVSTTGSPTITTVGSTTIYKFTASGSITF
jgi:hypothetical protein